MIIGGGSWVSGEKDSCEDYGCNDQKEYKEEEAALFNQSKNFTEEVMMTYFDI